MTLAGTTTMGQSGPRVMAKRGVTLYSPVSDAV